MLNQELPIIPVLGGAERLKLEDEYVRKISKASVAPPSPSAYD